MNDQWQPDDPACVERFKQLLGGDYFNHGGLLRVVTADDHVHELHAGDWLEVTPVEGAPDQVQRRVYRDDQRCMFGTKGGRCRNRAVVRSTEGFLYCAAHRVFCNTVAFDCDKPIRRADPEELS